MKIFFTVYERYEESEFWLNRLSMEEQISQISLKISLFVLQRWMKVAQVWNNRVMD